MECETGKLTFWLQTLKNLPRITRVLPSKARQDLVAHIRVFVLNRVVEILGKYVGVLICKAKVRRLQYLGISSLREVKRLTQEGVFGAKGPINHTLLQLLTRLVARGACSHGPGWLGITESVLKMVLVFTVIRVGNESTGGGMKNGYR